MLSSIILGLTIGTLIGLAIVGGCWCVSAGISLIAGDSDE